ncbi:MAG: DNA-deoxyinosine glycosylase [Burkholderiales bacterium]
MIDYGFPPISATSARVLILGSLPGQMSLRQRQYYAQSRNVFWRIMGALFAMKPDLPYDARIEQLIASNVALWDVCASARRKGSLDSAIDPNSVTPNDFNAFFKMHRSIELICLNGKKAAALYKRHVLPGLPKSKQQIRLEELPSTSPAHASMPYEQKIARWLIVRTVASTEPARI